MELNTLLNELLANNTGKVDSNIEDRTRRIEALVSGEFTGKINTIADLRVLLKSIQKNEDQWKIIIYGANTKTAKSPAKNAEEVEDIINIMPDNDIEKAIPENNPDGKGLNTMQKAVFNFIDGIEEQLQKIAIGDYESLFRAKRNKSMASDDEESADADYNVESYKRKAKNIIPIKIEIMGEDFYGIIRPGSAGGSNGIITWQRMVNSFDSILDRYTNKYDSLDDEEKKQYNFIKKEFLKSGKLPKTLPLIKRNSDSSFLKVHETQEVKALKSKHILIYKDDPETLKKVGDIVISAIKSSGEEFGGKNVSEMSDEEIAQHLGIVDGDVAIYAIPVWVINNVGFWNGIKQLF